jgi:hypothetical protein
MQLELNKFMYGEGITAPDLEGVDGIDRIALFDANCFFEGWEAEEHFKNDPEAYMPDSVLSEIFRQKREFAREIYSDFERKIIGEVDPRVRDRDGRNILDKISRRYRTEVNFKIERQDIAGRIEELAQSRDRLSEAVYGALRNTLEFHYVLNIAEEVCHEVRKKDGSQDPNIIYDAYLGALAFFTSYKTGKDVRVVSNDSDFLGFLEKRNYEPGILKRTSNKINEKLESGKYYNIEEKKLLENLAAIKRKVNPISLGRYINLAN